MLLNGLVFEAIVAARWIIREGWDIALWRWGQHLGRTCIIIPAGFDGVAGLHFHKSKFMFLQQVMGLALSSFTCKRIGEASYHLSVLSETL